MSDSDLDRGEQVARELFGDERFDRTRSSAPEDHRRDLLRLADEVIFGKTYTRGGLTLQERSLSTIAALTALSQLTQLEAHIGGGLNIGIPPEKIVEVIRQVTFYCGFPAGLNAMAVADRCIEVFAGDGT